jgi:hypothetical protein
MSEQKNLKRDLEKLFGPPALEQARHAIAPPEGLPLPESEVTVQGSRGRVLEVFRTARTRAQDGDRPPYGWHVRVLLEDGHIVLCKPAYERK